MKANASAIVATFILVVAQTCIVQASKPEPKAEPKSEPRNENALAGKEAEDRNGPAAPDLVLSNWGAVNVTPGPYMSITATVKNIGNAATANPIVVKFYASADAVITSSDIELGERSVPILAVNGESTVTSMYALPTAAAAGGYWVGTILDPNHQIKNESSDTSCSSVTRTGNTMGAPTYCNVITNIDTTGLRLHMQVTGSALLQSPATVIGINQAGANTVTLDLGANQTMTGGTFTFTNNNVSRTCGSKDPARSYPNCHKETNGGWKQGGPFTAGAEHMPTDVIAMRYTLRVVDGHGIIFHGNQLTTPGSTSPYISPITTDVMFRWWQYRDNPYGDPPVPVWPAPPGSVAHESEPSASLWVSNNDYGPTGEVGHTTSNPPLYPRMAPGIDGSTKLNRQDAIYQGTIIGQDITIVIRRRPDPVTFKTSQTGYGYRFDHGQFTARMPAATYWVWDVMVCQPNGVATTITMFKRLDMGKYVGGFLLTSEFFEFAGSGREYLWNVSALSENSKAWVPMNRFAITSAFNLAGLGPRVGTYEGHAVLEFATGIDSKAYAQNGAHLDIAAIAAPTNLATSAMPSQVSLIWTDNATNEDNYVVQRSSDGGSTWTTLTTSLPANSTSYADSAVTAVNSYSYRVWASSATLGGSNMSNIASVTSARWTMKKGPLMTRWAEKVDPDHPLAEYPRPQLVREQWLNLNGVWEYQSGSEGDGTPAGRKLSGEILVPFPVESAISGVMEHHDRLWYRRNFQVPADWRGKQLMLHFGAVDYEAEVFVNGRCVGSHAGGYDPFAFDIAPYLNSAGPQELIVRVFDPTADGGQPRGKQTTRPGGIMYTPTTGIWQTVWLEPVSVGGARDLKIVPDVDAGAVKVTVNADATNKPTRVKVIVKDGAKVVGTVEGAVNAELAIPLPDAKLWSPNRPFLYDLDISIGSDQGVIDKVKSYFGMRKIEIGEVNGVKKMLLNGKFVFQFGPLDQGFWPDGIYTAPTDEALKYDIEMTKALGFNMTRKHIKVEPLRWYYWTDKLGLLVWQDMPSANSYPWQGQKVPPVDKAAYERELTLMIRNLKNAPSIIMWEIFNEGQGQHDTEQLVALVKKLDPTRLVNEASGGAYTGSGDVFDLHAYPPPACPPPSRTQALACGEFGGIGFRVPGHMWINEGGGYTNVEAPSDLEELYAEFSNLVKTFRDEKGMSAAVYTQITDVMTEVNGLLTYDRVPKMDVGRIARANHFEWVGPRYIPVLATSEKQSQDWSYTTNAPAQNWMKPEFDDTSWTKGKGGFGTVGPPGIGLIGTTWNSPQIWLRKTFNPGSLTADQISKLYLRDYHDEDVEIHINGVLAYQAKGFISGYENRVLSAEARKAIVPNRPNLITISCKQTGGGQYLDAGLFIRESNE